MKHLFFKSTQVTKKEELDKFKDVLDEKANLKNQLAAMKRECNDLKSQSQEMDRLSIIESRVKKLKRRTLRDQSFTSLMADLRQDITGLSSFSRFLNGTFP